MYKTGDIILFKPTGFISSLIAKISGSKYSHSAVVFDDILDATFILEVDWSASRLICLDSLKRDHDVFRINQNFDANKFRENIIKSGKYFNIPYDYVQLFSFWRRFLFKAPIRSNEDKYICSEIVDRAFYDIDIVLVEDYRVGEVSPEDLAQSKLTQKIEEVRYESS